MDDYALRELPVAIALPGDGVDGDGGRPPNPPPRRPPSDPREWYRRTFSRVRRRQHPNRQERNQAAFYAGLDEDDGGEDVGLRAGCAVPLHRHVVRVDRHDDGWHERRRVETVWRTDEPPSHHEGAWWAGVECRLYGGREVGLFPEFVFNSLLFRRPPAVRTGFYKLAVKAAAKLGLHHLSAMVKCAVKVLTDDCPCLDCRKPELLEWQVFVKPAVEGWVWDGVRRDLCDIPCQDCYHDNAKSKRAYTGVWGSRPF